MELDETVSSLVHLVSCPDILWSEESGRMIITSQAYRAISALQSLSLSP